MTHAHAAGTVIGYVDGMSVERSLLDARLRALREGPHAAQLPASGTREARQLARWTAHVLFTELLCEAEARARGLMADRPLPLDPLAAVQLGSITAAAWQTDPAVSAVFADRHGLSAALAALSEPEATGNRGWRLSIAFGPTPAAAEAAPLRPMGWTDLHDLPRQLADTVRPFGTGMVIGPVEVGGTWYLVRIDDRSCTAIPPVAPPALPDLGALRDFTRWLDLQRAQRVHPAPGYEHPGDPRQPDNTHRH